MKRTSNRAASIDRPLGRGGVAGSAYEIRLAEDARWALSEGSKFFESKSAVQDTLLRITDRLRELGIEHAVIGGMALFAHGYRRFTDDVDLLVTREGLREIHRRLEGLGYVPPFEGSKNLRDAETGVKIEFVVTGDYPGDGKVKPVAFPDPSQVTVEIDGIRYVNLPKLIELKIASGMTSSERIRDLADIQELIKILVLASELAEQLDPFVRDKYLELWRGTRSATRRFVRVWRNTLSTDETGSLQAMIAALDDALGKLRAMFADGVSVDPKRGPAEGVYLFTTDPAIARKYDMHDESDFLGDEANQGGNEAPG